MERAVGEQSSVVVPESGNTTTTTTTTNRENISTEKSQLIALNRITQSFLVWWRIAFQRWLRVSVSEWACDARRSHSTLRTEYVINRPSARPDCIKFKNTKCQRWTVSSGVWNIEHNSLDRIEAIHVARFLRLWSFTFHSSIIGERYQLKICKRRQETMPPAAYFKWMGIIHCMCFDRKSTPPPLAADAMKKSEWIDRRKTKTRRKQKTVWTLSVEEKNRVEIILFEKKESEDTGREHRAHSSERQTYRAFGRETTRIHGAVPTIIVVYGGNSPLTLFYSVVIVCYLRLRCHYNTPMVSTNREQCREHKVLFWFLWK